MTNEKDKDIKTVGRPTTFSTQIADTICARMCEGESLRAICRDHYMPHRSSVYQWLRKNSAFRDLYTQARETLVEHWGDEMLEISDDGTTDFITKMGRNGTEYEAVDQEHIQRSRLRVDTRKWLMSKLAPRKYGDHVEVAHFGQVTVQHELSDRERMRRMALFLLEDQAAGEHTAGALIQGEASSVVQAEGVTQPGHNGQSEPGSDNV